MIYIVYHSEKVNIPTPEPIAAEPTAAGPVQEPTPEPTPEPTAPEPIDNDDIFTKFYRLITSLFD